MEEGLQGLGFIGITVFIGFFFPVTKDILGTERLSMQVRLKPGKRYVEHRGWRIDSSHFRSEESLRVFLARIWSPVLS